ncbi:MAG TPA: 2-amino-4-hydroxy-6-hydroxymethyldihydropteridine diphosphokinase [bacterium]|nr:2-amino-4-hydroxy-6-hydroxymethyldihydropteridine diphosphokinase [bacterium]
MNRAVIGLGSNIDPDAHIGRALEALSAFGAILKKSSVRETAPLGAVGDVPYKNGVVLVETEQDLEAFQSRLKVIEETLGRRQVQKTSQRITIDLDVVMWNGEVVRKEVFERSFLAESIQEIGEKIRQAIAR